jgi:CRP-like cAMP-binding protein
LAFGDSLDQDAVFIIESVVSILFFVDFYINCSTAFYDRNGVLVTRRGRILLKYLKGWMIVDLTSWFPFELIFGASGQSSKVLVIFARIPKLYRLFRISRMLHLFNNSFQKEMLEKFQELLNLKSSMVRLFKTFLTIILCVHIFSCFWYLAAKLNDFSPRTWVVRLGYQDSDVTTLYITCLYWTITTLSTCGYGDITPVTRLEQILSMSWMVTGLYFFSFTISNLNSMLSSYDLKENALSSKLAAIDEFASETNLKLSLRNKLKNSLRYASEKRGFSWNEKLSLIQELPKNLRYEIAINMHQGAAKSLNFFCNKETSLIALIVPLLDPIFIEKNCLVYKSGDFADEMYFLVKGNVRITLDLTSVIKSVQKGCYFGDVELFLGYSRRFSAHTTRNCDLLTMNKNLINEIKENHFSTWQEMMETATLRQMQYEKTVIEIHEMEKVFKGTVFTRKTLDDFKQSVNRILEERLKVLNKQPDIVTYATVVKKLNELIKVAAMKKFNLDNIDFINDFLLYA